MPAGSPNKAIAVVCIGAMVALAFVYLNYLTSGTVATDNAYVKGDIVPVSSRMAGQVTHFHILDYQKVAAGQPLFQLDTTSLKFNRLQQQARLKVLAARLTGINKSVEVQQLTAEKFHLALNRTKIEYQKASARFERARKLFASGSLPREEFENIRADAEILQLRNGESALALKNARRHLEILQARQDNILALQEQVEAMLAETDHDLLESTVRAPISGTIGKRLVHPGQYTTPGNPVVYLLPEKPLWVIANVKEKQIHRVRSGQKAEVVVDALPNQILTGSVLETSPATNSEFSHIPASNASGHFTRVTQTIQVKIALQSSTFMDHLKTGMSAEVKIHVEDRSGKTP